MCTVIFSTEAGLMASVRIQRHIGRYLCINIGCVDAGSMRLVDFFGPTCWLKRNNLHISFRVHYLEDVKHEWCLPRTTWQVYFIAVMPRPKAVRAMSWEPCYPPRVSLAGVLHTVLLDLQSKIPNVCQSGRDYRGIEPCLHCPYWQGSIRCQLPTSSPSLL